MVLLLRKTIWKFLKELRTESPYDSAVALLGAYKRTEGRYMKRPIPIFIAALQ